MYRGNVNWTEEGYRFAWRMLLRSKAGDAKFRIIDPNTGEEWILGNYPYLRAKQINTMAIQPDMILQYAHFLASKWRNVGDHYFSLRRIDDVEVYAEVWNELNGRKPQLLIDPNVDLAKVGRNLRHAKWILPLKQ